MLFIELLSYYERSNNWSDFWVPSQAEKYKKIEQVKKSLSEELDKMLKIEIDYE